MQSVIFVIALVAFVWVALKEQAKKQAEEHAKSKASKTAPEEQQSTVVPAVVPVEQRIFEPTIPSRMTKVHPWVEMCQAEEKVQKHYEILAQTPAIFRKAAAKAKSKKQRHRAA